MGTVQELAHEMSSAFERRTRDNGDTFVALKDGSPQWMTDVCHEAHGDMFPDDWRYSFIEAALDAIVDHESIEDARDSLDADIMNHNRLQWLASSLGRPGYCDQAMEEFGSDFSNTMDLIGLGQYYEKQEVFGLVLSALEALADGDEESEEEDAG